MLALASVLPVLAFNEKGAVSMNDTSKVVDLDEVVVISQPKEAFRLRRQPLSSQMFDAQSLGSLQVRDLRELSAFVPTFVMPEYGSRYTSSIYIRGIGSRVDNPAVGVYIDNIPLVNKSMFNFHTYQIDRIDVLRGAQGTLYGQNTEGGLVRMFSRSPLNYQGTDVQLSLGSGLYRKAEISHYQKFSDRLGMSLSAFYDGQNGFFHNTTTDGHADKMNEGGGRLRLLWQPTNQFSASLIADYQHVEQNAFPYGLLQPESGSVASPASGSMGSYRRDMLLTGLDLSYNARRFSLHSTTSWQYLKDAMFMDTDYLPGDYTSLRQNQLQNAVTQELSAKGLAWDRWHWTIGAFASRQWLKADAPCFFGDSITTPIANGIQRAMYNAMLNSMAQGMMQRPGMTMDAARTAAAAAIANRGGVNMDVSLEVPGLYRTPRTNLGLYHESNIDLTSRLTATLGLRLDHSQVEIDYDAHALMAMTADVMGTVATYELTSYLRHSHKNNYNQLLPKAALTYRLGSRGSNVYAVVSKGYMAGGYNMQMFASVLRTELGQNQSKGMRGSYDVPHTEADYQKVEGTISYKPEESWNYELGSHLNLAGGKVQLDLSGFYMQIKNQQLSVMDNTYGFGRMMVNAGKSYSCGVEATLRGSAFDNRLLWSMGYGFTHAVFKEYTDSVDDGTGKMRLADYKDKRVPFIPAHTFSASVDYRHLLNDDALLRSVVVGLNLSGRGRTYWDEANTYRQNLYATLGAHLDLDMHPVVVSFWGRNLTDTKFNTFAFDNDATGETLYFAQRGNPLQLGIDLRLHF